jgi:hypothetical protein
MAEQAKSFSRELAAVPKRFRILSLDGGGIYGLVNAIWLRRLCESDPLFLSQDHEKIHLLAGISSGAVNTLLLAKHENPRQACLDRVLENFWMEQIGAFSHVLNPVTAWMSWWGLGAWFGAEDLLTQLERHFGNMRLGDLKQPVLISTFDWSGTRDKINFDSPNPFSPELPLEWPPPPRWPRREQKLQWKPKIFTNLRPGDVDLGYRVVDVAYGAATPPGWRRIRGGIGDAGVFSPNPAIEAVAELLHFWKGRSTRGELLDRMAVLSLGDSSVVPHYWLKNFDLGMPQMLTIPVNPLMSQWTPPYMTVSIDAPMEEENFLATNLLGERYHRLDPPLMETPTLLATMLSRLPSWKQFFIDQIYEKTSTQRSDNEIVDTASFLKSESWRGTLP